MGYGVATESQIRPEAPVAGPISNPTRVLNRGFLAFPVGITQAALVKLAVGVARHFGRLVDGARQLLPGNLLTKPRHNRLGRLVGWLPPVPKFDDGLDLLTGIGVGNAEHGDVADGFVLHQRAFDLRRIDVEPTDDDHVVGSDIEEEETVVVEIADVTDREEVTQPRLLRLLRTVNKPS